MKESKYTGERQKIFSCCFNDEQTVRSQNFTLSNVSFLNGNMYSNGVSSQITNYRAFSTGVYSIRLKVSSIVPTANGFLLDFRYSSGIGSVSTSTINTITSSSGTIYVDGVATSTYSATSKDIIITGISLSQKSRFTLCSNMAYGSQFGIVGVELLEIYNYTLTAQEVSNLYNNSRYREVSSHGEQLGVNAFSNLDFTSNWTIVSAATIVDSNTFSTTDASSGIRNNTISLELNRRYRLRMSVICTNGKVCEIRDWGGVNLYYQWVGTGTTQIIDQYITISTIGTTGVYLRLASAGVGQMDVNYLLFEPVLANSVKPILDVCACNGVVKNKYSGDSYGSELVTDTTFQNSALWTLNRWTITNGVASVTSGASSTISLTTPPNVLVVGKTYRVTMFINELNASYLRVYIDIATYQNVFTTGLVSVDITCTNAGEYFAITATSPTGNNSISYLSIKEVIPSVVVTSTEVVKDNDVWAMKFNGSTSKIDCGSYDGLIGDKTFTAWVKPYGIGNSSVAGYLFTNGKISFYFSPTNKLVTFTSDGVTGASSAIGSVKTKQPSLVCITRTSTGIINIYVNGILSGTANQSSGTPIIGTIGITIGQTPTNSYVLKGLIGSFMIHDGLLTPQEIQSMYTSEKSRYGL